MKRVKFFLFLLPAIIFCLTAPKTVLAATASFSVTKDTYANQAYPDKVNGNYNHIILSNKYTTRLGYLQFEDIDLPGGVIIDQARFKFYVYSVNYAAEAKLNVGPITGDWEEGILTWNNKPTIDQTRATEGEISLTEDWKEVLITDIVRQWLDGSLENKGIFVYPYGFLYATPETEFAVTFRSKEAGENPPVIEVDYHLEPTPTAAPSETPTPSAITSPEEEAETTEEAVISPEAETSPAETPAPEATAEQESKLTFSLSTGQTIIIGAIIVLLIAAAVAFAISFRTKKDQKPQKEKEKEEASES
jgi:hypothetical protein